MFFNLWECICIHDVGNCSPYLLSLLMIHTQLTSNNLCGSKMSTLIQADLTNKQIILYMTELFLYQTLLMNLVKRGLMIVLELLNRGNICYNVCKNRLAWSTSKSPRCSLIFISFPTGQQW